MKRSRAELLGGPICPACFLQLGRSASTCPGCGQTKVLAYLDQAARRVCSACAGVRSLFACEQCGREDRPYGRRCAQCVLTERATALLTAPDGTVPATLRPVLTAMLAARHPKNVLFWLQNSKGPEILRRMALAQMPITHEALDAMPRTPTVDYLRDYLVAANALPARDIYLERVTSWLDVFIADRPSEQARTLRLFATWCVLRRVCTKAGQNMLTHSQAQRTRALIRCAAGLLEWLDKQEIAPADLSQSHLERWLTVCATSRRPDVAIFLSWARDQRLVRELHAPRYQETEPTDALPDELRWELVERLLHQDAIALELRVAGLFVLLFGQFLSRIAAMNVSQVKSTPAAVEVQFGDELVTMPPVLDDLVRALLARRGKATHPTDVHIWLFPGGNPGRPITAGTLGWRLRHIGIHRVRWARNAAMMQLAAEMPAPVLADVPGISATRAVSWAALAKRDWGANTAQRVSKRSTN
jgi:hypothetical protein